MKQNHPFHLVNPSPWPILCSLNTLGITTGSIMFIHMLNNKLMMISFLSIILCSFQWWRDITRESTFQGNHTIKVLMNMKWGMILFITSEIFFFIAFFWSFLHSSLSPTIEIGLKWPPTNILTFNPLMIPLLNTIILLSSGVSITWAHQCIQENNLYQSMESMLITVTLGMYFSSLQLFEYMQSSFSISDSIYGSSFFLATGFHGIHVIIGSTFILINMSRIKLLHFSKNHHFGFEAAAWYWHFVDIVWLFLYLMIYWWGS
uniref:Cytochrome c oxidase subunit 3 n=1 Tax=Elateroidea sp. 5 KM-2017 TaxID=2219428 RepID=A0A346RK41_9COLE|nr:cytochrome c oxidase subunit 3 [Elateroidea sp. 5 KM-2017]